MGQQQQFDFPRAAKLRALERVTCSHNVKSLLKALEAVIRDKDRDSVTYAALARSMGCSPKTAQRAVRTAEAAGLLDVWGDPTDGRSNEYRIDWVAVFDLPGAPGLPPPTPVKLSGDPGQVDRGPRSSCPGTPVKLTGVSAPDKERQNNATERSPEIGRAGGEGFSKRFSESWCGTIDREFPAAERRRLWQAAIGANMLAETPVNLVRFLAACRHAKTRPPEKRTGWFKTCIEGRDWGAIDKGHLRDALNEYTNRGCKLSDRERLEVYSLEPIASGANQ